MVPVGAFQSNAVNHKIIVKSQTETLITRCVESAVHLPPTLTRKQAAAAALSMAFGVRYAQAPQDQKVRVGKNEVSYGCAE